MAIDTLNLSELDRIKKIQDRIDAAEGKLNDIFAGYNIPTDITDSKAKLNFALTEIGDDQAARKEFNTKFKEAQEQIKLSKESIVEDFVNMTELGNDRIEKYAEKIREAEQEFEKQKLEEENKKSSIEALNEELKVLEDKKIEIQGVDGKGGKIAEEKAKSVKAKDEAKELAKKIAEIEAKIKEIDEKIEKLNEANRNTNDPEELRKNADEISKLQGEKSNLINSRSELSNQYQDKENEKSQYEQNIRNLQGELLNADSEIGAKSSEKNILENELRLMPIVGEELKKLKEDFEKQKEEYTNTVDSMEKVLNSKGMDVKSEKIEEPEAEKVEKTEKEKTEKETKKEEKPAAKENKSGVIPGVLNNNIFTPNEGEALPELPPYEKKRQNLKYIVGYISDDARLSSEDRLKRIQSEIGGKDFGNLVKAFKELKDSPENLSREEKNRLKEIMKEDKKNLAQTVKDVDIDKLDSLFKSVGINMSKSELKSLHHSSFEGQGTMDKLNNGFREYGEATYGVLDGFSQMSDNDRSKWEQVIKSYSNKKAEMSEDEVKSFEKYILTPVKFGTLHEQSKEVCKNSFLRLFSRGGNKKVEDIRTAIEKAEAPQEEISSKSNPKSFADNLKDQTHREPKNTEYPPRTGEEKSR